MITRLSTMILGLAALIGAGITGCGSSGDGSHLSGGPAAPEFQFAGTAPLKIVCTTGQVADAIREIAGDHAEISALMGPGVDPHLYRTVPSDVLLLQGADIVFYNGLHLEGRLVETLQKLGESKPVVAFAENLVAQQDERLRHPPEFEGHNDPHVWHDVSLWADCVDYAAERLAKFDPDRAAAYQSNAKRYHAQLDELDRWCHDEIGTLSKERRVLITAHDAFGYFSAAYGLETIGLKGISTEDEVDLQHMDEVVELLVRRKVPAVFVETSTAPRMIEALIGPCRKQGHAVRIGGELYSDALGSVESGAGTFEGMIRANVRTIVTALE